MDTKELTPDLLQARINMLEKELEEEQKNSYFWYEKYKKLNAKYNNFRKSVASIALLAEEEAEL